LRIIGGKYKGRVIAVSRRFKARPTTDFARESLFNILSNLIEFEKVKVLDLFGGTGSLSFEFASRGCQSIDIVDKDIHSLKAVQEMAGKLGIKGMNTIRTDAFRYIRSCHKKYDVIFADPPYTLEALQTIPALVFDSSLLEKDGMLILEHPKSIDFSGHAHFSDHRKYGHVNFSFFRS
jgi:16S rRNA (guanine966-N2)-methyltransferase